MDAVEKFVESYKQSLTGKSKLKTQTYISPAKLKERRFYWEAETEEGDVVEIDVQLPKLYISDAISFFFLAGYKSLFEKEVIEALPEGEESVELAKEAKKLWAEKEGIILLEYMFYLLWKQEEDEIREIINRCSQGSEWNKVVEKVEYGVVHDYVKNVFESIGLEYADALYNLVPLALDLYLYINSLKKPKIRKIDDEGVKERADEVARYL